MPDAILVLGPLVLEAWLLRGRLVLLLVGANGETWAVRGGEA